MEPTTPHAKPTLSIESPNVGRIRGGLARKLGIAAFFVVILPLLVSFVAGLAHDLTGVAALGALQEGSLVFSAIGAGLAMLSMTIGSVASHMPLVRPARASLEVVPDGLRIVSRGRARLIPRASIVDGLILPGERPRLTVHLSGGDLIEAQVPSEADGARLLAALGLGPEHRRVAVTLSPNIQVPIALGTVLTVFYWSMQLQSSIRVAIDATIGAFWLLGVSLAAAVAARIARPTRVIVGRDGVRIERAFSTAWIPLASITDAQAEGNQLHIERRVYCTVVLTGSADRVEVLARQIQAVLARGGGDALPATSALELRGRPIAVWRESLRTLLSAEGDYRKVALTPEDVLAALEDPAAPKDRRIGAALALAAAKHPEARTRIRIAAETSADEEMRAVLAQAAEEELDEAALERVLKAPARG